MEATFYQHIAPRLQHSPACSVPRPLLVQSSLSSRGGGALVLVLTDLRPQFPRHSGSLDLEHTQAALAWLAAFHAAFWEQPLPEGVWEEGSYWHLDTRHVSWPAVVGHVLGAPFVAITVHIRSCWDEPIATSKFHLGTPFGRRHRTGLIWTLGLSGTSTYTHPPTP